MLKRLSKLNNLNLQSLRKSSFLLLQLNTKAILLLSLRGRPLFSSNFVIDCRGWNWRGVNISLDFHKVEEW